MVRKLKQGSLTVETACVMPLVLLALMGLLSLCFFVHNRVWLTAAAYESAVSGSMEGIREDGKVYETARMRSEQLGSMGFYGTKNLSTQTNVGKKVQVTYDLETLPGFGNFFWHLHVEGTSSVVRPVGWVRKIKAAADIVKGFGD